MLEGKVQNVQNTQWEVALPAPTLAPGAPLELEGSGVPVGAQVGQASGGNVDMDTSPQGPTPRAALTDSLLFF